MQKKKLTADEIAVHLWDIEALLKKGQDIGAACEKIGVSEKMYQRWHRENAGQKPKYIKCLDDLREADKSGNVIETLDHFMELLRHQGEGRVLRETGFALSRKIAVLTRIKNDCEPFKEKPKVSFSSEAWERNDSGSEIAEGKIHEALVQEFSNLIRFYLMSAKKAGQPAKGELVSNITVDVKSDIGKQTSAAMLSYFTGYELPGPQIKILKDGWRMLGNYIEALAKEMSSLKK